MNSIDILEELKPKKIDLITLIRTFKKEGIDDFIVIRKEKFETLISENKELKGKNKELTDKLKDCDLHYSKLYKFHNNNCVTKDRINQIINELIKLYFEEDSYCFSGFMFNNKTFNSLNIKEEMTVMQLLKHLQRLLKQEKE